MEFVEFELDATMIMSSPSVASPDLVCPLLERLAVEKARQAKFVPFPKQVLQ